MRRDPLFYKLFQQRPELIFDLIGERPSNAQRYRFDSVAVKEPKFEIDGVFLPPEGEGPGVVFFCELQMQKDEKLYERAFSESLLYFYRNVEKFSDWQAVIIYPTRDTEQSKVYPHRSLLNGEQVHRIYLDELGDTRELPIPVAALVLTITPEAEATEVARDLLFRNEASDLSTPEKQGIIDLVTSIILYKFTNLSQREVRAMLGIDLTQEPRAIREAKEEMRGQEAIALVTRLLTRRLGEGFPKWIGACLPLLPLEKLEDLAEALLDFVGLTDFQTWITQPEVVLGMMEKHFKDVGKIEADLREQVTSLPQATRLVFVQKLPTFATLEEVEADLAD